MIGDSASEADLPSIVEQVEANGMADGLLDDRTRAVVGPVSGMEQRANGVEVEKPRVVRQQVIAVPPFAGAPDGGHHFHAGQAEA